MFPIDRLDTSLLNDTAIIQLFDSYRLVDPDTQDVFDYRNGQLVQIQDTKCYAVWCRNLPCANCTSSWAAIRNRATMKFDRLQSRTYLVISVPCDIQGRRMVLELVKDVEDSLMIHIGNKDNTTISGLLDELDTAVMTDQNTGLYNKQYFFSRLPSMLHSLVKMEERRYCGALFDIDRFKMINDQHGHLMGDEVIRYVADLFRTISQGNAIIPVRFGGDEFYLGFSGYTYEQAKDICDKICGQVGSHRFGNGTTGEFNVTLSYGLEEFDDDGAMSIAEFINRIDAKMYAAKQQSPRS